MIRIAYVRTSGLILIGATVFPCGLTVRLFIDAQINSGG